MDEQSPPTPVSRYVEELVECGVQLAAILDHMLRHQNPDPSVPRPPEVLRDLVAEVLAPRIGDRTDDIELATGLLTETSETIGRELFLVEHEGRDGSPHEGRWH